MSDNLRYLIEAVRGGGRTSMKGGKVVDQQYGPNRPPASGKRPLDQRRRGYQLYAQEAQVNQEPVKSYEEWIQAQE